MLRTNQQNLVTEQPAIARRTVKNLPHTKVSETGGKFANKVRVVIAAGKFLAPTIQAHAVVAPTEVGVIAAAAGEDDELSIKTQ